MPNDNLIPPQGDSATPTPTETPLVPPQIPVATAMKMPAGTEVVPESKPPYMAILFGVLVLLLALALGGFYLWGSMIAKDAEEQQVLDAATASSTPQETPVVTESDSIETIEADLEGESFESIDAELEAIDAEIEGGAGAQ